MRVVALGFLLVLGCVLGGCGERGQAGGVSTLTVEGTVDLVSVPTSRGVVTDTYDFAICDQNGDLWTYPRDVLWPRGTRVRLRIEGAGQERRVVEIVVLSSPPGDPCRPMKWPHVVPGMLQPGQVYSSDDRR